MHDLVGVAAPIEDVADDGGVEARQALDEIQIGRCGAHCGCPPGVRFKVARFSSDSDGKAGRLSSRLGGVVQREQRAIEIPVGKTGEVGGAEASGVHFDNTGGDRQVGGAVGDRSLDRDQLLALRLDAQTA